MIDLRAASLLDFLPESISSDPEIIALSLAIDPELRDVGAAIIEAVIMPRLDVVDEAILDEIAWACRFDELQLWDNLPVAGKRTLLAGIFKLRKKSGTPFAVHRVFDALGFTAKIIEWWQEGAAAFTYRIRIFLDEIGITLAQLVQISEWIHRFEPTRAKLTELAVEDDRRAPLHIHPAVTVGRHTTIAFGGP